MLGIAAERVFLLVSESMENALANPQEKIALTQILEKFPMKPKLDWIHNKFQFIQNQKRKFPTFPENATLMVSAMYDFIRSQRNDLGHPRDIPPNVTKDDAFVNLQMFPRYYQTAEAARIFLASNKV